MLQKQQKLPTGNIQEAFRTTIFKELNSGSLDKFNSEFELWETNLKLMRHFFERGFLFTFMAFQLPDPLFPVPIALNNQGHYVFPRLILSTYTTDVPFPHTTPGNDPLTGEVVEEHHFLFVINFSFHPSKGVPYQRVWKWFANYYHRGQHRPWAKLHGHQSTAVSMHALTYAEALEVRAAVQQAFSKQDRLMHVLLTMVVAYNPKEIVSQDDENEPDNVEAIPGLEQMLQQIFDMSVKDTSEEETCDASVGEGTSSAISPSGRTKFFGGN